ncbi:MAG: nuclear transport factor 2 family protein [Hyphomicrobiaceae bacterium]
MSAPPIEWSPERIVEAQLSAYNARDIDAFMAFWHPDCSYYAFPDQLLAKGAAAIRQRHIERFAEPDLNGRLLSRMAVGNIVVDRESVTRTFPSGRGSVEVIAIYEVDNGLITKAWFKQGQPVVA